jgi:DnaJ-class molecular chaperone
MPFPAAIIPEGNDEEETKTLCPACRGCGKSELVPIAPSTYRWVRCEFCKGEGTVPISAASGFRRRVPSP